MGLTANLCVALGFVFAIYVVAQLIHLAKRAHDSRARIRQQRQAGTVNLSSRVGYQRDIPKVNYLYNLSKFYWELANYRQGNVFSTEERPNNRYGDIFFIEPGSEEANRIRDQLEKDEKDLPSYDEVMRMCNLTTPTAAAAAGVPVTVPPQSPLGDLAAPIGIAALPAVPPYSETDPHAPVAGAATVITMEPIEPSTSRAAQTPSSPAPGGAPAAGYQRPETSIVPAANVSSV